LIVLETERLSLRHLADEDAAFVLELVNDPDWLRFIGDRGVRSPDDARAPVGMCGLLKRDWLDDVDVGFAFLPRFREMGLAHEAARATLDFGTSALELPRIAAIVSPENAGSIRLLETLGMRFERMAVPPGAEQEVCVYAT
jgi:RimJ/RimL family protein N-acetyltransferase